MNWTLEGIETELVTEFHRLTWEIEHVISEMALLRCYWRRQVFCLFRFKGLAQWGICVHEAKTYCSLTEEEVALQGLPRRTPEGCEPGGLWPCGAGGDGCAWKRTLGEVWTPSGQIPLVTFSILLSQAAAIFHGTWWKCPVLSLEKWNLPASLVENAKHGGR